MPSGSGVGLASGGRVGRGDGLARGARVERGEGVGKTGSGTAIGVGSGIGVGVGVGVGVGSRAPGRKLSALRECRKDGGYGTKSRQAGLKNVHSEHELCLLRQ